MLNLHRIINRLTSSSPTTSTSASRALRIGAVIPSKNGVEAAQFVASRAFSETPGSAGGKDDGGDQSAAETFGSSPLDDLGWDSVSSWSTRLTKEHFDGEVAGHHITTQSLEIAKLQAIDDQMKELQDEYEEVRSLWMIGRIVCRRLLCCRSKYKNWVPEGLISRIQRRLKCIDCTRKTPRFTQ